MSSYKPYVKTEDGLVDLLADCVKSDEIKTIIPIYANTRYAVSASDTDISSVTAFVPKASQVSARMRGVAYGNDKFVIVGASGAVQYSSDNGETWTSVAAFTANVIVSITYGRGYFVCVDSAGGVFKSSDLTTWTAVTAGITSVIEAVIYTAGRFVIVGNNGLIAFSDNLTSFNIVTSGISTSDITTVVYGRDRYVAFTADAKIIYSIDGATWIDSSISGDTNNYRASCYGKGLFVAGANAGNIIYSSNGLTWTAATHSSASTISYIRGLTYVDGKFYAVMYTSGGAGEIWTSNNGSSWTTLQTTTGRLWCIASGNDILVASGDSGATYVLNLDITWYDEEPEITSSQALWWQSYQYLSDGSTVLSDIELCANIKNIYAELDTKQVLTAMTTVSQTTVEMQPNRLYMFPDATNTQYAITLTEGESGVANEYMGEINVDEDTDATFNVPSSVRWVACDGVTVGSGSLTLASKATYQFSILNGIGLIAKADNPSLAATTVTLSGDALSWTAVADAASYDVIYTATQVSSSSGTINTAALAYDISSIGLATGAYSFTVKAKSIYYNDSTSSAVTYYKTSTLSAPADVAVSALGAVSWTAVTNANSYTVYVGGASVGTTTSTLYTLGSYAAGTYSVTVKASNATYPNVYLTSEASAAVPYAVAQLTAPTISLSGTTLSWDAITNAVSYSVYSSGTAIATGLTTTSATLSAYLTTAGTYTITVKAIGNAKAYLDSDASNSVSYVITELATPANVAVSGTSLSWDAITNASSYTIAYSGAASGTITGITANSSSLSGLTAAGTYSITVTAIGNGTTYLNSAASTAVSYTVS